MNKHTEKYKQLSFNISYHRKRQGFSQLEFAEKINISRTHYSKIEAPNVVNPFSLNVLFDIADALDIEPAKLFDFSK